MELNTSTRPFRSAGIAVLVAAVFGAGYWYHGHGAISEAYAITRPAQIPSSGTLSVNPALPDFSEMVAQQGPAVVNISVSGTMKTGGVQGMPQLNPDDPFYEFFRRFHPPAPESDTPIQAMGSGFIIRSDGVVLTNAHVVAEADEVTVKLTDKREFKAKVVGVDRTSDVAVLKIDAKNLPTVKIGDPQGARVGQWVVAIGSPFGFENSVTAGIVSAKSRSLPDEGYVPFLQTDVAINPGNSGGPLFNLNGEVIGINSQIYSRSGGYQGLSFAIPIDVAMRVEQQIMEHGKVTRGRIGVMIQPMTQELASSFGLDKPHGALVAEVEKGSPADKAGIEAGDVIIRFNGKEIDASQELPPLVADSSPGSTVQLEVWHDKKVKTTSLRVGEMNSAVASDDSAKPAKVKLGISVRPLSDEEKKDANISQGVVVDQVGEGPGARAGIEPGDVILSVNGDRVGSVDQLRNLVDKSRGHLALLVQRGSRKMFVPVNVG